MKNVIFLDRDGTLIVEPPDFKIDSLEKLEILPNVIESLKKFTRHGYSLIIVSNQGTLGTRTFTQESFDIPQAKLMSIFTENGITFEGVFFCPHVTAQGCSCKKPKTGMIDNFLKSNEIDLEISYVIGDRDADVNLAKNIGCKSVYKSTGPNIGADFVSNDWNEITKFILE